MTEKYQQYGEVFLLNILSTYHLMMPYCLRAGELLVWLPER